MSGKVRIIGIDPGLRRTGWGVIEHAGSRLSFVACGVLMIPADVALSERLKAIHDGLRDVIVTFEPQDAAVEVTFVSINPESTLKLGQARGVALLVPALAGLQVGEYAANLVKKTVVGAGHADKAQIRRMVEILLPTAKITSADAADALAIAITHAHHRQIARLSATQARESA
ncbi:crossover junction endodeoxyribonuclease RuvC [Candidatus Raskinella chloraquaticus]|uniref:Crossover junction endodeoxyribonuclease RuvC n=1 Tax=Candidatus Raskinella chloraquaticus TaxID=1951219 RepID=A0A1W9I417_9HYPH|nr:MAG: crossover junction endodeoxyribonuclease RuvC [Proteobacteria bacterium SG_bin8]